MDKNKILELNKKYADLNSYYGYIIQVFGFDQETIMPKKALNKSGEAFSYFMNEYFKITKSEEYINFVKEAYKHKDEFNDEYKRLFELRYRNLMRNESITPELNNKLTLATQNGFAKWLEAKGENDYSIFEDALAQMVKVGNEVIELKKKPGQTNYDVLLDEYEFGNNEKILDEFFSKLKARIVPLIKEIKNAKKKINTEWLHRPVDINIQKDLSNWLLHFNRFDLERGYIGEAEHPFTTFPSKDDTRLTTHYYLNDFSNNVYSVIHEGGHGIFGQNEPDSYYQIGLEESMSSAQHETISRFYENIIGRNKAYVSKLRDKINELTNGQFNDISLDDFYDGINYSAPTFKRTESDELTYSIHILIRYELEKALINGKITTKGLNKEWNRLYKEYLDLDVENDNQGILQDVHWAQGSFGYFPSYALGNAYGAQILNTMKKEVNIEECIKNEKLEVVKDWLKEHVFKYGSLLDAKEWIVKITGEELNTDYYLDYLENKYRKIYEIEK